MALVVFWLIKRVSAPFYLWQDLLILLKGWVRYIRLWFYVDREYAALDHLTSKMQRARERFDYKALDEINNILNQSAQSIQNKHPQFYTCLSIEVNKQIDYSIHLAQELMDAIWSGKGLKEQYDKLSILVLSKPEPGRFNLRLKELLNDLNKDKWILISTSYKAEFENRTSRQGY